MKYVAKAEVAENRSRALREEFLPNIMGHAEGYMIYEGETCSYFCETTLIFDSISNYFARAFYQIGVFEFEVVSLEEGIVRAVSLWDSIGGARYKKVLERPVIEEEINEFNKLEERAIVRSGKQSKEEAAKILINESREGTTSLNKLRAMSAFGPVSITEETGSEKVKRQWDTMFEKWAVSEGISDESVRNLKDLVSTSTDIEDGLYMAKEDSGNQERPKPTVKGMKLFRYEEPNKMTVGQWLDENLETKFKYDFHKKENSYGYRVRIYDKQNRSIEFEGYNTDELDWAMDKALREGDWK